jgi:hydrogenase expression/formation protein HypE
LKEGKLPIELLSKLLSICGANVEGVILPAEIGLDSAAVDVKKGMIYAQTYYDTAEECHLIVKSDPITFVTPNPSYYAVAVNANDLACLGAIPYGCTATILAPPSFSPMDITAVQVELDKICKEMNIAIIGGHTEITSAVSSLILSLSMFGWVPKSMLPMRNVEIGDFLALIGYLGNEGTSILANEINKQLKKDLISKEDIILFQRQLFIGKTALCINKSFKPKLMHDPTEGGILGAIYEIFYGLKAKFGINIEKDILTRHIHPITTKIAELLSIDPLCLISSGSLLAIVSSQQKSDFLRWASTSTLPCSIIGEINNKELSLDGQPLKAPVADHLIQAFTALDSLR